MKDIKNTKTIDILNNIFNLSFKETEVEETETETVESKEKNNTTSVKEKSTVPKDVFNLKNKELKEVKEKLREYEEKKQIEKEETLKKEWKMEELLKMKEKELEEIKNKFNQKEINEQIEKIKKNSWIPEKYLEYISWSNVEEVKQWIEKFNETFWKELLNLKTKDKIKVGKETWVKENWKKKDSFYDSIYKLIS